MKKPSMCKELKKLMTQWRDETTKWPYYRTAYLCLSFLVLLGASFASYLSEINFFWIVVVLPIVGLIHNAYVPSSEPQDNYEEIPDKFLFKLAVSSKIVPAVKSAAGVKLRELSDLELPFHFNDLFIICWNIDMEEEKKERIPGEGFKMLTDFLRPIAKKDFLN